MKILLSITVTLTYHDKFGKNIESAMLLDLMARFWSQYIDNRTSVRLEELEIFLNILPWQNGSKLRKNGAKLT